MRRVRWRTSNPPSRGPSSQFRRREADGHSRVAPRPVHAMFPGSSVRRGLRLSLGVSSRLQSRLTVRAQLRLRLRRSMAMCVPSNDIVRAALQSIRISLELSSAGGSAIAGWPVDRRLTIYGIPKELAVAKCVYGPPTSLSVPSTEHVYARRLLWSYRSSVSRYAISVFACA